MNLPMAPTLPMASKPEALSAEQIDALQREVRQLAHQRNAVILAHNYQLPEIQDVADHVGDSLGLSRLAAAAEDETIAFCGVHFMAETASILCPQKTVLIPDLDAGCSLAASIDAEQLADWRAEHPRGVVVMYVNTTADVKALTDYCCTSANAVEVVRHIYETHGEHTEILFGPTCGSAPTWSASSGAVCMCGTASATCTRGSARPTSRPRARRTPALTS
jgi:quinolinate synthase